MGAWGPDIFENDDAGDWIYALEESGAAAVDRALSAVLIGAADGMVEAPEGSAGLASAEAVAAAFGAPKDGLGEEAQAAFETHAEAIRGHQDVRTRAIQAVIAVLGKSSELVALWGEDGVSEDDFQAFMASARDVAFRIKGTMSGDPA